LQNKAEFSQLLTELNLPQPETVVVGTRAELGQAWRYPLYVKLAHSTAGGGVFYIENEAALSTLADRLEADGLLQGQADVLVQQPARGVLSTVQAVFNQGELVGLHCFESRRLGVGGMSTARTSADHSVVREHAERIGQHLGWHGAFFIDYFYDRASGQPEYIEANPRIGETVNAMLSGINLPQLVVRVSRGESPPRAPLGRFGVRTHNTLMILMSRAYDCGKRRDVLRELYRCVSRDELYMNGEDELTRPREDWMSILPFAWTSLQLLAWPRIARRIVAKTVGGYSLPRSATEEIRGMSVEELNR
jgi:predicted ATP-grasp superfamily ATP-dependent carboligase